MSLKTHTAAYLSVKVQMLSLPPSCKMADASWSHSEEGPGEEQTRKAPWRHQSFFTSRFLPSKHWVVGQKSLGREIHFNCEPGLSDSIGVLSVRKKRKMAFGRKLALPTTTHWPQKFKSMSGMLATCTCICFIL